MRPNPISYDSVSLLGLDTFDAESVKAFFYGLANGMTYIAMESNLSSDATTLQTNCFYAMWGLVDTNELLVYDIKNILADPGSFNWFNVLAYDPLHAVGDTLVVY